MVLLFYVLQVTQVELNETHGDTRGFVTESFS